MSFILFCNWFNYQLSQLSAYCTSGKKLKKLIVFRTILTRESKSSTQSCSLFCIVECYLLSQLAKQLFILTFYLSNRYLNQIHEIRLILKITQYKVNNIHLVSLSATFGQERPSFPQQFNYYYNVIFLFLLMINVYVDVCLQL